MIIDTLRFGKLDLPESALLTMSEGLLGFPDCCRFLLLPYGDQASVCWLQSADDPSLAFLAIEPHVFFPEYEVTISDSEAVALGLTSSENAALLVLLTVSREATAVTANLAGPVVINTANRSGRQIVLDDDRYSTKHLLAELSGDLRERRSACSS